MTFARLHLRSPRCSQPCEGLTITVAVTASSVGKSIILVREQKISRKPDKLIPSKRAGVACTSLCRSSPSRPTTKEVNQHSVWRSTTIRLREDPSQSSRVESPASLSASPRKTACRVHGSKSPSDKDCWTEAQPWRPLPLPVPKQDQHVCSLNASIQSSPK